MLKDSGIISLSDNFSSITKLKDLNIDCMIILNYRFKN